MIFIFQQEKYPKTREEKRLRKQKSQESLQLRNLVVHNIPERGSIPFIDQSPVDPITAPNFANLSIILDRRQLPAKQQEATRHNLETERSLAFKGSFLDKVIIQKL